MIKKIILAIALLLPLFANAEKKAEEPKLVVTTSSDNIFLPSDDCYPDPVLDSIVFEGNKIYVEDHIMTSGELSYIMHRVNPSLYDVAKKGQKLYLFGTLGMFVGAGMICTGSYWKEHYTGSKKDAGKALLISGVPVAAAGTTVFTVGIIKHGKAIRQFKHNCLGVSQNIDLNMGVGVNCLNFSLIW